MTLQDKILACTALAIFIVLLGTVENGESAESTPTPTPTTPKQDTEIICTAEPLALLAQPGNEPLVAVTCCTISKFSFAPVCEIKIFTSREFETLRETATPKNSRDEFAI